MGRDFTRRAFDFSVALILLLIALPTILVLSLGVAISLRAWPFFSQTRVGRDGEPFRFLKLRTLPPSAPRYASKYDIQDIRAPWLCRLLRALHLDELPQLFLVLSGKMSLVGPRPEMPVVFETYPKQFAQSRVAVRPGCTGLWQVSTACDQMIAEHPEFDEFYVRNRSLRLDLWIIVRTVTTSFTGRRGVGSLGELPAWAFAETTEPATVLSARVLSADTSFANDIELEMEMAG
jgi:lipopolysaccharide/colanic/teichoic acid biosynthesis glycosyltransferase